MTSSDLYEKLLKFLQQPASYPHKPGDIEHIQTHISHVFLAGSLVFKIKKPVNFEFLDFSKLEKRKHYCCREVELNRRLCKDIYLGVVPIIYKEKSFRFEEEDAEENEIIEYAVKMQRLSEEHFLHSYIENESLTADHLDRVADKLARFYNNQKPDGDILKWGRIENIRINTDENFEQTEPFIGQTIDEVSFNTIQKFTNRYFEDHEALFNRRIQDKRIVDGHGDLHLEHIHMTSDKVCIYDCIEFNDRFRYGDLAADIAFLAMDLDFNNCWKEERYFVDKMVEKLGDQDLLQIIDFYKCYRAYVKGKVKSLQSAEEEVSAKDRIQSAEKASAYFDLSLRYALLASRPTVLIFMGRVASGKSTLAEHLSEKLNIKRFSSDYVRKKMAGLPLDERTPASIRSEIYSREMSVKTYNTLREEAERKIQNEQSAIVDATFSRREGRREWIEKLEDQEIWYYFIEACASDATIKDRLKKRDEKEHIVSDARLEDFEKLNEQYEAPEEIADRHLIQVGTDQSLNDTLKELYSGLLERNL